MIRFLVIDKRDGQTYLCRAENWEGAIEEALDHLWDKSGGPCNYAGGGLFGLNPVVVTMPDGKSQTCFEFADAEPAAVESAPTHVAPPAGGGSR